MTTNFKTNYKLLGLPRTARWPDAKARYKKLVQIWHPDKFDQDSREYTQVHHKFLEITKAYEQLKHYYKTHKLLPFEDEVEESNPVIVDLSRRHNQSSRRVSSYRHKYNSNRSKLPLIVGIVVLLYLAYSSFNDASNSSHKTNIFDINQQRTGQADQSLGGDNEDAQHRFTANKDFFGAPKTSVGSVLNRQLYKSSN